MRPSSRSFAPSEPVSGANLTVFDVFSKLPAPPLLPMQFRFERPLAIRDMSLVPACDS